jgi:5,10-methylene-tetrahydrofolate dehydrogenase/methenyl tetrahydrofolate cyclohydrolase
MCVQLNNTPQVKTGTFINVKQKIFLCVGLSFNKIIFNVNCSQTVNERRLNLVQSLNKMCSLTGILYLDLIVFNKIN